MKTTPIRSARNGHLNRDQSEATRQTAGRSEAGRKEHHKRTGRSDQPGQ